MAKKLHNESIEFSATILATDATGKSEILDLGAARLLAIQMPSAWTATVLTFLASSDGETFAPVYIADIEYSVAVAASRIVMLDFNLYGLQYIQLRSGTAGTPVQQAADRTIKLICASRP
jgi:hypothetical protein